MSVTTPFLEASSSCILVYQRRRTVTKKEAKMFRQKRKVFVTFLLVYLYCNAASACDRWLEAQNPKGIVLLTQGMNLKAEKLVPLAEFLVDQNFSVFLPSFQGHCRDRGSYFTATAEDWLNDTENFFRVAQQRAKEKKVPLYLVAYSFSALLFELRPDLKFQKRILFAPAFATHYWYPVVRLVAKWFPHWRFRTRNLAEYAANSESSLHSVKVIGDLLERLNAHSEKSQSGETATLVLADLEDELVNVPQVQKVVEARPTWRFVAVTNKGNLLPKSFHHLIVTPDSVSPDEWQRIKSLIGEFLH